jgi:chemotaxis protein CheD
MILSERELPTIYIGSGEICFTDQPNVIVTVLGSCVSVTLFHRRLGLGAICHGLLPHCRNRGACSHTCAESAKYVECSLRTMVGRFKQHGIAVRELETGLYGGADMFGASSSARSRFSVGKQNIETAFSVLETEGLQVFDKNVGGRQGRKIHFNTRTGEVRLMLLQPGVVLAENNGNNKGK